MGRDKTGEANPYEDGGPAAEAVERVRRAIRSFDFGDYGLDDVDHVKDEEWVEHLAALIVKRAFS